MATRFTTPEELVKDLKKTDVQVRAAIEKSKPRVLRFSGKTLIPKADVSKISAELAKDGK